LKIKGNDITVVVITPLAMGVVDMREGSTMTTVTFLPFIIMVIVAVVIVIIAPYASDGARYHKGIWCDV
jgi:hypothetical protein